MHAFLIHFIQNSQRHKGAGVEKNEKQMYNTYKLRAKLVFFCSSRLTRTGLYIFFATYKAMFLKFQSNWHRECRLVAVRTVNVFLATLCGNRSSYPKGHPLVR